MSDCINLRERFGDRFKITFDPAYSPKHAHKSKLDPWMMQIPCKRHGDTIYPFGAFLMAVETRHLRSCAKRLADLGLKVHQDGDQEVTFLFRLDQWDAVAAIVRPRKKRRLTPEQKAKIAERGFGRKVTHSTLDKALSETLN